MVKHRIHLRLTRIVARANGVHVCLLHQLNVLQHGLHVDASSENGVRVLRVHAFEIDLLAIHIDALVVTDADVAETVFRRESLQFVGSVVAEREFDGVECGMLR